MKAKYPSVSWSVNPRVSYPNFKAVVEGFSLHGYEFEGKWSVAINGKSLYDQRYESEDAAKQALLEAMHAEIDAIVERARPFIVQGM